MPVTPHAARMEDVSENRLLSRWATLLRRAPDQMGAVHETDAELVPLGDGRLLALTVDSLVEELAVGLYPARTAGRVAVVSCLSDLAAVGAEPLGLLLSVTLPEPTASAVQDAVAAGAGEACEEAGAHVLGGDTSLGDALQLTAVGAGVLPLGLALTRKGCAPGDRVYATGPFGLGGASAATTLLGLGTETVAFRPPVRSRAGVALRGLATTCIDASDGLIAALDQIARLNQVAIRITRPLDTLLHPAARSLARAAGLPAFPFLAGHHGDFELVFTSAAPPDRLAGAAERGGFRRLPIGRVEAGSGVRVGERDIDTARLRDLASRAAGDVAGYLAALVEESRHAPSL